MDVKMRVVKRYTTAFERQIGESVHINNNLNENTILLNSKNEYNRCSIPRLKIDEDKSEEIERLKEEKEERELRGMLSRLREKMRNEDVNQPRCKRQKTYDLKEIKLECDRIIKENKEGWKKKHLENLKRREEEEKLKTERERRLSRAREKKQKLKAHKIHYDF